MTIYRYSVYIDNHNRYDIGSSERAPAPAS